MGFAPVKGWLATSCASSDQALRAPPSRRAVPGGRSSSLDDLYPSAGRIDRLKRMRYAEQQWTGNFTTRAIMFLNQVRMMRKYGFFHRNPVPAECSPPPEI